jgi:hypothetical protein
VFYEFVEILILVVRGALFAGLCWGAWLCLGKQTAQRRPANSPPPNHQPLKRFATFAKAKASKPSDETPAPAAESRAA